MWRLRLKQHMKHVGVTQEKVAEAMGVTQGAVAHWLKGRREINLTEFFDLCEHAVADPEEMLFGTRSGEALVGELRELLETQPIGALRRRQFERSLPKPPRGVTERRRAGKARTK